MATRRQESPPQVARAMLLGFLPLNKNEDLCCQIVLDCLLRGCFVDFEELERPVAVRLASILNPQALSQQQYENICSTLRRHAVDDLRLIHIYTLDKVY